MLDLRLLASLGLLLVLAGCASSAFTPSATSAGGTPYAGLEENSYGPRSAAQFRSCDPQGSAGGTGNAAAPPTSRVAAATQSVTNTVSSAISAPVQGMMKIDATLQRLGLERHIRDPVATDHPPVAVLSHSKDGIVFWHSARTVKLVDVTQAAQAYCNQLGRGLLYRGSASRCPPPHPSLSGAPVFDTYAISAFACTARP